MSQRPTCPVCGGPIETGGEDRFSVTLEDIADGSAHVSTHSVCRDCWDGFLDAVRVNRRKVIV